MLDELARDPGFDFYCLIDSEAGLERLKVGLAARPRRDPFRFCWKLARLAGAPACAAWNRASRLRKESPGLRRRSPYGASRHSKDLRRPTCRTAAGGSRGHAGGSRRSPRMSPAGLVRRRRDPAQRWRLGLPRPGHGEPCQGLPPRSRLVLRSGCYLTHDSLHYRHLADAMAARDPAVAALGEGCSLRSRSSPRCNPAPNPVA